MIILKPVNKLFRHPIHDFMKWIYIGWLILLFNENQLNVIKTLNSICISIGTGKIFYLLFEEASSQIVTR